jgi:AcrR family transcriptional regulator
MSSQSRLREIEPARASKRGQVVRDRIVAAAYRLFVDRGFAEVGIEQIADAAGVSRRTVYNKFVGKADIYREAFGEAIERLAASACVARDESDTPRDLLRRYAATMTRLVALPEMVDLMRVLVNDGDCQPWLAEAYLTRIRKPLRASLMADIERLVDRGALPRGNARAMCEQFYATTTGLIAFPRLLRLEPQAPAAADDLIEPTIDSLLLAWKAAA